jgi:hypothetical protein
MAENRLSAEVSAGYLESVGCLGGAGYLGNAEYLVGGGTPLYL